jgi:lipopolysaccharide/colanic/teichoic acid biosynthesis glycosyltransferase
MRSVVRRGAEADVARVPDAAPYRQLGGFAYGVKGASDRVAAAAALVALAIPLLAVALLVKLSSPGPVFVRQSRVGRFGQPFTFYKFRSMRQDAELVRDELEIRNHHTGPTIFKMKRDPRITGVGGFLRRSSLDELPNLFNVLRGEMSMIGPRPPLPREVAHYTQRHMQRLATTPGMTGLWQVSGRSELSFEEMVDLDLQYIEKWSLWLDVTILIKTPLVVVNGRGAW